MTPAGLAQTHAAAFGGKGWPAKDFAAYLADAAVLICGDERCFAVFRLAGPEAEVLTFATHPDAQGQGRATRVLGESLQKLAETRVEDVFLDVAEDNTPARALYARAGFVQFSTRHTYYANGADAICMKAELRAGSPGLKGC